MPSRRFEISIFSRERRCATTQIGNAKNMRKKNALGPDFCVFRAAGMRETRAGVRVVQRRAHVRFRAADNLGAKCELF